MIKEQEKYFSVLLLLMDIFGLGIAYEFSIQISFSLIPLWDFFNRPEPAFKQPFLPYQWDYYLNLIPGIMILWPIFLKLSHGYETIQVEKRNLIIRSTTLACLGAGAVFFIFITLITRLQESLSFLIPFLPLSWAFLFLNRAAIAFFIKFFRKRGHFIKYLIIVGTNERSLKAANLFAEHPEWGVRLVGFLASSGKKLNEEFSTYPVVGTIKDLQRVFEEHVVDSLLFTEEMRDTFQIKNLAYQCQLRGIEFSLNPSTFIEKFSDVKLEDLGGFPLIEFTSVYQDPQELFFKRLIDLAGSIFLLVVFCPLFPILAYLIKKDSPGPAVYHQERVGKHGRRFIMYKFRSMIINAEKMQEDLKHLDEMNGPAFKMRDDPRITRIGKFIRTTSLDELPQLYNVLRGDMSLVGPRPPMMKEVLKYQPWQMKRLSVKPGITCLWQVTGRNEIGFDEWMSLDLQYIENWSLTLDFKILLNTIPAVVSRKGAR
ncbi:MAG: sugar transferase [Pseudomonadota bacterium]